MGSHFYKFASKISKWMGHPIAFLIALLIVVIWGVTGPIFSFSNTWQLVINTGTTVATFLMVFLIQNSQNRDGMAIQTKLDELIKAIENADNTKIGIEHLTDREIEKLRKELEK